MKRQFRFWCFINTIFNRSLKSVDWWCLLAHVILISTIFSPPFQYFGLLYSLCKNPILIIWVGRNSYIILLCVILNFVVSLAFWCHRIFIKIMLWFRNSVYFFRAGNTIFEMKLFLGKTDRILLSTIVNIFIL